MGPACEVIASSSSEHVSQLFTGFAMLARRGEIELSLRKARDYRPGLGGRLDVVVDGHRRLVYDLNDGADVREEYGLAEADVFFKRSYDPTVLGEIPDRAKILPLGLNLPCYGPGDRSSRRALWSLAAIRSAGAKDAMLSAAMLTRPGSRVVGVGRSPGWLSRIEGVPELAARPRALLLTRLWDPAKAGDGAKAEEWRAINEFRVGCIRLLRSALGPRFTGGLTPTPIAVAEHADLVVSERITRKARYLGLMHDHDVCLASAGLRGSNGWRLAEYLAGARAIVTEPLRHAAPGLLDGVHYLSASTPEAVVTSTLRLLDDEAARFDMMRANAEYYRSHVRPDALVRRSLAAADEHLSGRKATAETDRPS